MNCHLLRGTSNSQTPTHTDMHNYRYICIYTYMHGEAGRKPRLAPFLLCSLTTVEERQAETRLPRVATARPRDLSAPSAAVSKIVFDMYRELYLCFVFLVKSYI